MKKNEVKKCKVCREEATCSFTSLVTTVGSKPRMQKGTTATHLCSRCIRVWAMTTRPEVGQPVVDAIEALTRHSVRMAADIKPDELRFMGVDFGLSDPRDVQRPQLVPKKTAKKPEGIRVRLSFKERDILEDALVDTLVGIPDDIDDGGEVAETRKLLSKLVNR